MSVGLSRISRKLSFKNAPKPNHAVWGFFKASVFLSRSSRLYPKGLHGLMSNPTRYIMFFNEHSNSHMIVVWMKLRYESYLLTVLWNGSRY